MLTEALTALAAAGGTAVAQAAGTEAWTGIRQRAARLLGRGDPQRERAQLERLDVTAAALVSAVADEANLVRQGQAAEWRARFETLLEDLDGSAGGEVAAELRALVAEAARAAGSGARMEGNVFHGPAAIQVGDRNRQNNRFGPGA